MLLKFITCLSGTDRVIRPGEIVEMPSDEGLRHLINGNAVEVDPSGVELAALAPDPVAVAAGLIETAAQAPDETAVEPEVKPRKTRRVR